MRKVPDNSRYNSNSSIENEDGYASEVAGWEVENPFNCEKELKKLNSNLVDFVNKKIPLKNLLEKSKLHFSEVYSPSGWSHKRSCPFPDHNDSSPSFYYNPVDDRFVCHGCHRGGKAVQFYAYLKKISIMSAAECLSETLGSAEDIFVDIENEKQNKIDEVILEFSNFVRSFIRKHNSFYAMEFAEKVTWSLDLYLTKHLSRSTIDESNLIARVNILKEMLNEYAK